MVNKQSLWFQVEQEIANLLLDRLEAESITLEQATEIARFIIQMIPHEMSDQEMLKIIPKLDDKFTELAGVVYKHLQDYENEHGPGIEQLAEKLVKEGRLVEASKLMEEYFLKFK